MKPPLRSRHARLLALCGLSAAVHLALLHWFAVHRPARAGPDAGPPGPLLVRLAPAPAAVAVPRVAPAPVASPDASPATSPATTVEAAAPGTQPPASRTAPMLAASTLAAEPDSVRPAAPASTPAPSPAAAAPPDAATASDPPASPAPAVQPGPPSPGAADPAPSGDAPLPLARVARRYRTGVPNARRLAYAIVPDGAALHPDAAPAAYLDWRPDGDRYALEMDGVLGRLSSSGVIGDEGLAPARADERAGAREAAIRFEEDGRRVVLDDGAAMPGTIGLQDRASALLRLAGIGLGGPAQLRGAIAVPVADAAGVRVDSYAVIGQEDVVTGRGKVAAWHLAQRAAPGQARLELWLAPDYDWLPVRLRLVRPDGSGVAQVMLRAEPN